jgi:competence protein ComEC
MVGLTLALIVGLTLGMTFPWPWQTWAGLVAAPVALGAVWLWRSRRIHGPEPPAGALVWVAMIGVGCLLGSRMERSDRRALAAIPDWADLAAVRVEGTLDEEPTARRDGAVELVLRDVALASRDAATSPVRLSCRVAVQAREGAAASLVANGARSLPLPGRRVAAWGNLRRADALQTAPNAFRPWSYWRGRGIFCRVSVSQPGDLELEETNPKLGTRNSELGSSKFKTKPNPISVFRVPRSEFRVSESGAVTLVLRGVRQAMVANMARRLSGEELAVARALILGQAEQVGDDDRQAFARAGLAHLLAVAGLHVGFALMMIVVVGRLCVVAARLCGFCLSPRGVAWICIAGLIAYAALTGWRPPVTRAAAMGVIVLFGFAIGRWTTPLGSLATAAWLTLLWDPRNLIRMDWQLSYACVLAIVLIAPPLQELLTRMDLPDDPRARPRPRPPWRRWVNRWILLPMGVVLAAQLGLAPLQVAYFRYLSLVAWPANVICVPLAMVAFIASAIASMLGGVPFLGAALGAPAHWSLAALLGIVHWTNALPLTSVNQDPLPLWITALFYFVLLGMPALLAGRGPRGALDARQRASLLIHPALCMAILAVAPLLSAYLGEYPRDAGWLDFYVLDVGQGDSLVARFPNGRVMVIDGGPNAPVDRGKTTVAPFLRSLGIDRIDCLIATHADADHVGGLPDLLREFQVGTVVLGPAQSTSKIFAELLRSIDAKRVPVIAARQGAALEGFDIRNAELGTRNTEKRIELANAKLESPNKSVQVRLLGPIPGMDDNDASVVTLITDGDARVLAMGDLSAVGERRLLDAGLAPRAQVLKVGHHGSRFSTSDAFLDAVRPRLALISVGARNNFGHPSPEVLARLARHGAVIERDDQLGTIWIRTDGRWIESFAFAAPD